MGAILCRTCYQDIPAASLGCPRCGAPLPAREAAPPTGSPWEHRSRKGRVAAFGETLQQSLFEPTAFFRTLRPGRGGDALRYAVAVNVITAFVAWLWRSALQGPGVAERAGLEIPGFLFAGFLLVVLPVLVILAVFSWSSVLHLSLAMTGAASRGFSATLQAVAYAASANGFSVFPFAGSLVGIPWGIALQIIGIREGHGISTGRAVFAWILPFLLFVSALAVAAYFAMDAILGLFPEIEGLIMAAA